MLAQGGVKMVEDLSRFEKDMLLTSEIQIHPIALVIARRAEEMGEQRHSDKPQYSDVRKVLGEFFVKHATPAATFESMREGAVALLMDPEVEVTVSALSAALIVDSIHAVEEAQKRI